jgi:hypothetical protein
VAATTDQDRHRIGEARVSNEITMVKAGRSPITSVTSRSDSIDRPGCPSDARSGVLHVEWLVETHPHQTADLGQPSGRLPLELVVRVLHRKSPGGWMMTNDDAQANEQRDHLLQNHSRDKGQHHSVPLEQPRPE